MNKLSSMELKQDMIIGWVRLKPTLSVSDLYLKHYLFYSITKIAINNNSINNQYYYLNEINKWYPANIFVMSSINFN